jgi:hypothetical protein
MKKSLKRPIIIGIVVVIAIAIAVVAGLHLATRVLKSQVEQALGPDSEVAEIVVNWTSIEVRGVRIRGPKGWPAEDALRAERIVVSPDLLGLFSARLHVPRVVVDNAYLSVLRAHNGKLRLLPGLLEKPKAEANGGAAPAPAFTIGTIELRHGVLDFFDATVRTPAYRTRLEQLHAKVEDLRFPGLSGRTAIQLDGTVKGVQRNGRLSINGWAELASKNSEIVTKLQGVDLVALQPYLIKASETGVRHGALDLTMKSVVRNNRLRAPGTVTLTGLELASGGSGLSTFMGVPRQAVVAALKNRKGQITVDFTLEGDLNDPKFSLNESFAKHIGTSVAETLGISIEGLTRGVGGAAEGLGGMMKKLFGK